MGQQEAVETTLMALLAGGHVLLEGGPGLGKTRLARPWPTASISIFAASSSPPI